VTQLSVLYRPETLDEMVGQPAAVAYVKGMVKNNQNPGCILISGGSGCVDKNTEYLSPIGWRKISEYDGGLVAQFNEKDETSTFVKPLEYINLPCENMYHFHTKYGIDMMLSSEHRIIYSTFKRKAFKNGSNNKYLETTARDLFKSGKCNVYIPCTFKPKITGTKLDMSDIELRLQVASMADGHYPKHENIICINIKKFRKIKRMRALLERSDFKWRERPQSNGYTRFYYTPIIHTKTYDQRFWMASGHQCKIIADEVIHWDGSKNSFFTRDKASADFIQYAFIMAGYSARLFRYKRDNGIDYVVFRHRRNFLGLHSIENVSVKKTMDGRKYCFSVPSTMLILRRNGCIFITGNSGKTSLARIIASMMSGGSNDPKTNPDIIEVAANVERGIEDVRSIIIKSRYNPRNGKRRIMIIDEAHAYTGPAASALLKETEEPAPRTTWILCSDQASKLPRQLLNRAQSISLNIVEDKDLIKLLKWVMKNERISFGINEEAILKRLAEAAYGVPRQAIQLLESVSTTIRGGGKASEAIRMAICSNSVTETFDASIKLIKAILNGNQKEAVSVINSSGTCDGMLELIIRMLPACSFVANGGRPKDGLGYAATKAIGRFNLDDILALQTRVIAALDLRVRSNYQITSEALLLSLTRKL